jgi:hypothetical protein
MTTVPKSRTGRKQARRLHASQPHHGAVAIRIEQTTGNVTKSSGYYVTELPACKGGRGFHFERFGVEVEDASEPAHDVFLSTDGFNSCDCIGFSRWHHCKHHDAAKELVRLGKFDAIRPVIVNALEPMARALLGGELHRQICCSCGNPIPQCRCEI